MTDRRQIPDDKKNTYRMIKNAIEALFLWIEPYEFALKMSQPLINVLLLLDTWSDDADLTIQAKDEQGNPVGEAIEGVSAEYFIKFTGEPGSREIIFVQAFQLEDEEPEYAPDGAPIIRYCLRESMNAIELRNKAFALVPWDSLAPEMAATLTGVNSNDVAEEDMSEVDAEHDEVLRRLEEREEESDE